MLDGLYIHDVPVECINRAAVTYFVPAKIIISVLQTERGWAGLANRNKNGSVDYGPMQINSIWLEDIKPYGYTRQQIQYDPCINVMVGTWILSREIAEGKSIWQGVGNYHSHTFKHHFLYKKKVLLHYTQLKRVLDN